jgi:hypothetical protein
MRAQPNNFSGLFDGQGFSDVALGAIDTDYTFIAWWSSAMRGMSVALANLNAYLAKNPTWDPEDNTFKKLRLSLDNAMAAVDRRVKNEFSEPFGLLAMDLASGQNAATTLQMACAKFGFQSSRNLTTKSTAAAG